MNKKDFKIYWNINEYDQWTEFDYKQLERAKLTDLTKNFLSGGFPDGAAPCVDFGLESSDGKFYNITEYYSDIDLVKGTENYWIFGSDGAGNPICIDSSSNDKIVLLDHELGFEKIQDINQNIIELAKCLLEFKNFISEIESEFGEDAFMDSKFSKANVDDLKERFKKINPNIFLESEFWKIEVECLYDEIE
ncbi:hypothetical protein [Maribacter sp. R77961]|uniref:hypothetical protein n=1 Tax=Maribacter sp. R77961 TaxID=3093871 RepID=UPI0037CC622F